MASNKVQPCPREEPTTQVNPLNAHILSEGENKGRVILMILTGLDGWSRVGSDLSQGYAREFEGFDRQSIEGRAFVARGTKLFCRLCKTSKGSLV